MFQIHTAKLTIRQHGSCGTGGSGSGRAGSPRRYVRRLIILLCLIPFAVESRYIRVYITAVTESRLQRINCIRTNARTSVPSQILKSNRQNYPFFASDPLSAAECGRSRVPGVSVSNKELRKF